MKMVNRQTVFRWTLLIVSGFAVLYIFFPFLMEILLASFFAFALGPLTTKLFSHKIFGRKGWVAITILGLILAIILPIVLLGVSFFNLVSDFSSADFQSSEFFKDIVQARNFVLNSAGDFMETFNIKKRFDITGMTNQFLSSIGSKIMTGSAALASQIPDFVLSLLIFCCALYLFLSEGRKIRFLLTHNRFIPARDTDRLIQIFQNSCYATLVASVIVGFIQALTVTIGSALLKADHLLLIFLVTFIFSFIPVLGAAPVAFFLGVVTLIKGDSGLAIGYGVLGIIAGTMDNFIRPMLVRGDGNVHAGVMLIAIIGAIMLFGLPGLFLGPMFVSVAVQIYSLFFFRTEEDPKLEHESVEVMNEL